MQEGTMKMLPVSQIYPHPDNPRKELGDLAELTDSIKKNGIMQNLTVMPGHYLTKKEQDALEEEYAETHEKDLQKILQEGWTKDGFTLLIGHRRAAAAKEAGMMTVPCTIVKGLDKKEQLGIMLEENMQRTDLTIREQAQGFQMMLDLGDTVETVAKKTGFSKATIKHRLAIAALDPAAIAAAEDGGFYQISISDYMKLEKLPTVEDRNAVLRDAKNGRQLDYKIKFRLEQIEKEKKTEEISARLERAGIRKAKSGVSRWAPDYESVRTVRYEDAEKGIGKIEDPETCVWVSGYEGVEVLRKKPKEKKHTLSEFDKEQNWNKRRRKQCREIQKEMDAMRRSFILRIANHDVMPAPVEREREIIDELLGIAFGGDAWLSKEGLIEYYTGRHQWDMSEKEKKETTRRLEVMGVIPRLLMCVDKHFDMRTGTDVENLVNYDGTTNKDRAKRLQKLYNIIRLEYGYVMTKEESQIVMLTHEVFETYKEAKEAGRT